MILLACILKHSDDTYNNQWVGHGNKQNAYKSFNSFKNYLKAKKCQKNINFHLILNNLQWNVTFS